MAFVDKIIHDEININVILQLKQENGTQYIDTNRMAAIIIQRHFRGYYTRAYFSKLHLAATTIQKYWKGYIARR